MLYDFTGFKNQAGTTPITTLLNKVIANMVRTAITPTDFNRIKNTDVLFLPKQGKWQMADCSNGQYCAKANYNNVLGIRFQSEGNVCLKVFVDASRLTAESLFWPSTQKFILRELRFELGKLLAVAPPAPAKRISRREVHRREVAKLVKTPFRELFKLER